MRRPRVQRPGILAGTVIALAGVTGAAMLSGVDRRARDAARVDIACSAKVIEPVPPPAATTVSLADRPDRDAASYASAHGVSPEEAQLRLGWQQASVEVAEQIVSVAPGRHSGTWIQHEPEWALVVAFSGKADGLEEACELAAAAPMPVQIRAGQAHSEDELLGAQLRASAALDHGQMAGTYTDIREGRVVIQVLAGTSYAAERGRLESRLEDEFGVPFRVEVVESAGDD